MRGVVCVGVCVCDFSSYFFLIANNNINNCSTLLHMLLLTDAELHPRNFRSALFCLLLWKSMHAIHLKVSSQNETKQKINFIVDTHYTLLLACVALK